MSKMNEGTNMVEVEPPELVANRRSDWRNNHLLIQKAIIEFTKQYQRFPTYREIVKLTGFELKTVYTHMQELDSKMIHQDTKQMLSMLSDQVAIALLNTGLQGNVQALKILLKMIMGYDMSAPISPMALANSVADINQQKLSVEDTETTDQTLQHILVLVQQRAERSASFVVNQT